MKICMLSILLLAILRPGGCPDYEFDLKTVEQPSQFSNSLQFESDLDSELSQDTWNLNLGKGAQKEVESMEENDATDESEETDAKKSGPKCEHTTVAPAEIDNFVGTNLFDGHRKNCFSPEDVALLTARKDFELLIPKDLPQCLLNDTMVCVLMQYFYSANQVVQRMTDDCTKLIAEKAFYDTLGGYLKYYIVPVTKFSFYAGKVELKTVENVITLYQQCKMFLNTNGNGWSAPMTNVLNELKNVRIEPLKIAPREDETEEPSSCIHLDLSAINNDAEDEQMIVSIPKLEAEDRDGYLGNVWLPLKRKRTFNLRSSKAEGVIVKFYETVTRCYRFQSICQDTYNHKFKAWISENIQVHLSDEQFYPGLGAILRIYENLRRGKKSVVLDDADNDSPDDGNDDDTGHGEEVFDDDYEESSESKRQKSEKFKEIEKVSKQKNAKPETWFDKIYNDHIKSRKTECKKKGGAKESTAEATSTQSSRNYLKYVFALIGLILLLLLLIILCFICSKIFIAIKRRSECENPNETKPKDTNPKETKPKDTKPVTTQTPPPTPPPAKRTRKSWCQRLCNKKKKTEDEEISIKPESTSVITTKPSRQFSTSTSSLACQPKGKCLPYTKGGKSSDKSDAPVIETTSMDYSTSEPDEESKKPTKSKQKVVTIDEKKNKTEPQPKKRFSAKSKNENTSSTEPIYENVKSKRKDGRSSTLGLQRSTKPTDDDVQSNRKQAESQSSAKTKSQNSASWDTMYDS